MKSMSSGFSNETGGPNMALKTRKQSFSDCLFSSPIVVEIIFTIAVCAYNMRFSGRNVMAVAKIASNGVFVSSRETFTAAFMLCTKTS